MNSSFPMQSPAAPASPAPDASTSTAGAVAEPAWHPLPPRARAVLMLSHALGFGIPATGLAIASGVLSGSALDGRTSLAIAGSLLLLGIVFGAWLGAKRHRHTLWSMGPDGFGVRRGRLWFSDTRVPLSRVQHLDIKRGPLERGRDLATLVVHTAGTREHAVTVPALDAGDAEHLRDALARASGLHEDDDDA